VPDTIAIHPTAPLAERVLAPGDPGLALALSQTLLRAPKMFNHHRGLWGYTGTAADGEPLTIQSTGIGGPSTAVVIVELHGLGARRLVHLGTCSALDPDLELGRLLIPGRALAGDGTSRALGAAPIVAPDRGLVTRLTAGDDGTTREGLVASCDVLYSGLQNPRDSWLAAGARAVDMETATVFVLAGRLGLEAAGALVVSDLLDSRRRIGAEALAEAGQRAGALAASALALSAPPAQPPG
jgi:uridine phosphorylase